jgi:rare lipoprotein A
VPNLFSRIWTVAPIRITGFCFIVLGILLGNGCSHTLKDGPPRYYVDENKVPNAVPKIEPLSKNGNMSHYKVFGKQYNVMASSRNYEEQGIASWYGTKFNSHYTSNGERYNMLAMTAAHKTLPLPTYVQVTNLANGRQIIVKVNDRGPFEANRLIDLSYVAAKKLGMMGHGTARVNVKAIDPRDALMHPEMIALKTPIPENHYLTQPAKLTLTAQSSPPQRNIGNISPYTQTQVAANKPAKIVGTTTTSPHLVAAVYIQVGAFRNRSYAEKLKTRLSTLFASPVAINSTKKFYRVQVGPFNDLAAAEKMSKRLQAIGLHTKRVNDEFDIT